MSGACSTNGEERYVNFLLVGKPEGRRPLEIARRWWVNNIKMDLGETGWVVWTGLVWLRI
jgi:hypothetical protein